MIKARTFGTAYKEYLVTVIEGNSLRDWVSTHMCM